ncbi:MAG: hypothetical protein HY001_05500 [Candidatus Portnoybacteria bacterium]|nr:hypothetical protein [Candidatus Portnoybacteria bacterium]
MEKEPSIKRDTERKTTLIEFDDPIGSLNYLLSFDINPLDEFISREQEDEMLASGDHEKIAKVEKYNRNLHMRNRLYSALDAIKIFAEEHLPQEEAAYFIDGANHVIKEYADDVEREKRKRGSEDFVAVMQGQEPSDAQIRMPLTRTELVTRTHELLKELKQKLLDKGLT